MTSRTTLLTALLALNLLATAPAMAQDASDFERGVAAYEDGDYEAAAGFWEPLAENGESEAQRNLAQLYRLGLGVERDNARAFELYTAAAEQNSVDAQVNAAFLLLTGEGVEKDPRQAALWFARAADQGDALAQFNLGLMYEKGVGVEQDRIIARELYQLAANQGQKRALARLDAIEATLPPDGGEAAREERLAREKAKMDAQERVAQRERAEVERAEAKAREKAEAEQKAKDAEEETRMAKAEAAAKSGPILMMEKVEDEPAKGEAEDADATSESASAKSPKADDAKPSRKSAKADAPSRNARIRAVKDAEAAYAKGDYRKSARLLMPLAREGMPVAQFWMGRLFNRGEGVKLDRFEAYSLWRSATESGSGQAATALANLSNRLSPQELARAEQYHQRKMRQLAAQRGG